MAVPDDSLIPNPFLGKAEQVGPALKQMCIVCEKRLEPSQFTTNNKGVKVDVCKFCSATSKERAAELRKQQQIANGLKQLTKEAAKKTVSLPAVALVCATLYDLHDYGGHKGVEGFCREWKDAAMHAGPKQKLDYFTAVVRLTAEANRQQSEQIDWSTVTEEELDAALQDYMLRVYRGNEETDQEADARTA
jgi:hypothetical protein